MCVYRYREENMESLFCNEVWLMSPSSVDQRHANKQHCYGTSSFYDTKEDCEEDFKFCLKKEITCMHEPGYVDHLKSNDSINFARFKAIQWLIQCRSRLNMTFGTVFNAANYLDRFISMNQCRGWKYWMIELLSVACLSIASKFGETDPPPLHEIQMQVVDHSFQSSLIQRMELTVLKTLDWRLNCATSYSYVELMTWNIDSLIKPLLLNELTPRLTELLLGVLLDCKFLAFRPCVIALSVLRCALEELLPSTCDAHLTHFTALISQDQMDDIMKCHKMMRDRLYGLVASSLMRSKSDPSSPVTVLTMDRVYMFDCQVDLSLFNMPNLNDLKQSKKRKRGEE